MTTPDARLREALELLKGFVTIDDRMELLKHTLAARTFLAHAALASSPSTPPTTVRLRRALEVAKVKLELYRELSDGYYIGGMEYTALMKLIDNALAGGERVLVDRTEEVFDSYNTEDHEPPYLVIEIPMNGLAHEGDTVRVIVVEAE